MNLTEFLTDAVGLTLVHWDSARGLACFWNGNTVFLEYHVHPDRLEHGGSWSISSRPVTVADALDVTRRHYGLTLD